jgi:hypothetical protein
VVVVVCLEVEVLEAVDSVVVAVLEDLVAVVLETVVVEILEHLVAVEVDWEAVGVSAVVVLEVTGVLVVVDGEVEAGEVVADLLD